MTNEPKIIDIMPNPVGNIGKSFRKDWHIYVLCLVTIIVCFVFYSNAQSKLDVAVRSCNDFWQKQMEENCLLIHDENNINEFNLSLGEIVDEISIDIGGNKK